MNRWNLKQTYKKIEIYFKVSQSCFGKCANRCNFVGVPVK